MLISSFNLTDGTIVSPMLLFYLKLGLVCRKIYRFVQYTPRNCFNNFVQSAVGAQRQGDENPNSSVVAETMKLLSNSSYGYQIMHRSRHTVTKSLTDEKTHIAINSKMFKRLNHNTDQLYQVELVKLEIEHREPIFVGFSVLDYAKLRMLEHYYNVFKKFCDLDKYEDLEMDTDSLYLALSEEKLEDVIFPKKRAEWDQLRSEDWTDSFTANATDSFFRRTGELSLMPTTNMIGESRASSKESLDVQKCCVSVSKHIVVMISILTNTSLAANDSIKELFKTVDLDQCQIIAKY